MKKIRVYMVKMGEKTVHWSCLLLGFGGLSSLSIPSVGKQMFQESEYTVREFVMNAILLSEWGKTTQELPEDWTSKIEWWFDTKIEWWFDTKPVSYDFWLGAEKAWQETHFKNKHESHNIKSLMFEHGKIQVSNNQCDELFVKDKMNDITLRFGICQDGLYFTCGSMVQPIVVNGMIAWKISNK